MSDPYEREAAKAAIQTLERKLARVVNQRDTLIEGLEKIASPDFVITLPDRMDAVRELARQTIQIANNNKH